MNTDIEILRKMIVERSLVTDLKDENNSNYLVLEENSATAQYDLRIHNTPENTIAIKSDDFSFPTKIFNCRHNECKRADYVIIAKDGRKKWIIYVELKRGSKVRKSHIINQLEGSKCFIEYCRVIGQTFFGEPKFLDAKDYLPRYVSIKIISIDKQPFNMKEQPPLHDTAKKMLPIRTLPGRGVIFKMLIRPED